MWCAHKWDTRTIYSFLYSFRIWSDIKTINIVYSKTHEYIFSAGRSRHYYLTKLLGILNGLLSLPIGGRRSCVLHRNTSNRYAGCNHSVNTLSSRDQDILIRTRVLLPNRFNYFPAWRLVMLCTWLHDVTIFGVLHLFK